MCFCVVQIDRSMSSTTHGPAVENGELLSPPTMAQQVIPGLGSHAPIPVPRPRPPIPVLRPPPINPAPTTQPAPPTQQYPLRKPFLWGQHERYIGQGAFGTVSLVHQIQSHALLGGTQSGHHSTQHHSTQQQPTQQQPTSPPGGSSTLTAHVEVVRPTQKGA